MAKREFSAGGIVFRRKSRGFEVLLIKDVYGRWTWPKGHIDRDEKSQDAALREIEEEAGLKNIRILGRIGRNNYFFRLKEDLIFKTVYFFLVQADSAEKLKVQKAEIEDARWFKPDEALKTVEYKGAREMLEKAIEMYKAEKREK
ncbi:MAG: NUDIX domain-containing protein [Candidatus Omnitrophica bacterium]|nr:NUDIX domain-containing protein [Candidatus Omnitrophota bacterium]